MILITQPDKQTRPAEVLSRVKELEFWRYKGDRLVISDSFGSGCASTSEFFLGDGSLWPPWGILLPTLIPHLRGKIKRTCFLFQERSRYYKMVQTGLSGPQGELYQIQRSLKFPWFGAGNSLERVALFPYFCCHCRCCRKSRVMGCGGVGGRTWSHWRRGCWSLRWFNRQVPMGSQALTCHTMLGRVLGPLSYHIFGSVMQ